MFGSDISIFASNGGGLKKERKRSLALASGNL
jgi:hypothetical protein